jgi:hypothetical protein
MRSDQVRLALQILDFYQLSWQPCHASSLLVHWFLDLCLLLQLRLDHPVLSLIVPFYFRSL